jgi:hypothetical protein
MTARRGTYPPRITEHGAVGGSDLPLGIAKRRHRNLPSLAKERNPGPKNGLYIERRVSQFYTICDKNQLLDENIEEVMAILILTCTGLGAPD